MKCWKFDVEPEKNSLQYPSLRGQVKVQGKQSKYSRKKVDFARRFVHTTTPRLMGVTSRSTARKCSPDAVECAKIGLEARNLMYLVISLVFVMGPELEQHHKNHSNH